MFCAEIVGGVGGGVCGVCGVCGVVGVGAGTGGVGGSGGGRGVSDVVGVVVVGVGGVVVGGGVGVGCWYFLLLLQFRQVLPLAGARFASYYASKKHIITHRLKPVNSITITSY